ncbi:hypothetical protein [Nocardia australiensis]|uniref:hypothetical protein n=1 Tax=Nocardia australiensis TaxID=2887191 RepID=UPI001D13AD11|nr:hypothetical protein [Nocardia australiensis]
MTDAVLAAAAARVSPDRFVCAPVVIDYRSIVSADAEVRRISGREPGTGETA